MDINISDQEINEIVHRVVENTLALPATQPIAVTELKQTTPSETAKKVVAIGTDHGGVDLKAILKKELIEKGYEVIDCGTHTKDSVDYPDIALSVSKKVAGGEAWRGIVIDGAGIGSCMAANKVPGVRAAMCYDYATAVNSREHNDANVLTLGAGLIGTNLTKLIMNTWLTTNFGGGRHARRVNKITAIEQSYYKDGKNS
ncbi:MAG: ribose 5-phosphate isomerase B [Anaerolineaceae bacterium]|nr:ribose 5-phosphate isomerase B [Anaerolineaceae bacterium]